MWAPVSERLLRCLTRPARFVLPDGTTVNGFLVKPVDYRPGSKYPTVLDIHGGPTSQRQHEFMDRWQQFAANGYAVVSMNPRGSTGRAASR